MSIPGAAPELPGPQLAHSRIPISFSRGPTKGEWLHDSEAEAMPPEKLLQLVWQHQRLTRDHLCTADGRAVHVLHPGFWNREAGPDFRNAILQFDQMPPESGDIEIDLHAQGWQAHHHHQNAAYKKVILHVIWDQKKVTKAPGTEGIPTLLLRPHLDAPIKELEQSLSAHPVTWPEHVSGQCALPLSNLSHDTIRDVLRQAALLRLKSKAELFRARARQAGWEQALWDGLFSALGYKHNIWPMRRIAELRPAILASLPMEAPIATLQARLLGISGLLPPSLPNAQATVKAYLRDLWNIWWRERADFAEWILPKSLWTLHGLRPANHPQRRLALAAHWLCKNDLVSELDAWFTSSCSEDGVLSLLQLFQVPDDPFWSRHWTWRSRSFPQPQPLLGRQRLTDIAVNVVLPWFWSRAESGNNPQLMEDAAARYFAWPASEDNAVLRLASQRMFGLKKLRLHSAALQQGLLQIVRDFCSQSNALCDHCDFPQLMLNLGGGENSR